MVAHTCNPSYLGGGGKRIEVKGQLENLPKNKLKAKGLGSAQVVEL
jgi:hypothetical protein